MKNEFRQIYEDVYDKFDKPFYFKLYSRHYSKKIKKIIDEEIDYQKNIDKFNIREDGKLFLLANAYHMFAMILGHPDAPEDLELDNQWSHLKDDLKTIFNRTKIIARDDGETEITGQHVLKATSTEWPNLKLNGLHIWA